MQIGGFQKVSLIDYPGKVACVVFTQGCNFRCPYCHNSELIPLVTGRDLIPEQQILGFLERRQDKLQGVVITGGEPTLQHDLISFLQKIKSLRYSIKLDTNGSRPWVLREVLNSGLVDFIAMDIKATPEKYFQLAGTPVSLPNIQESMDLILSSGLEHQFRSTIIRNLLSEADVLRIRDWIKNTSPYILQNFSAGPLVLDKGLLDQRHYTDTEFAVLKDKVDSIRCYGLQPVA